MFQSVIEGITVADLEGIIIDCNERAVTCMELAQRKIF